MLRFIFITLPQYLRSPPLMLHVTTRLYAATPIAATPRYAINITLLSLLRYALYIVYLRELAGSRY